MKYEPWVPAVLMQIHQSKSIRKRGGDGESDPQMILLERLIGIKGEHYLPKRDLERAWERIKNKYIPKLQRKTTLDNHEFSYPLRLYSKLRRIHHESKLAGTESEIEAPKGWSNYKKISEHAHLLLEMMKMDSGSYRGIMLRHGIAPNLAEHIVTLLAEGHGDLHRHYSEIKPLSYHAGGCKKKAFITRSICVEFYSMFGQIIAPTAAVFAAAVYGDEVNGKYVEKTCSAKTFVSPHLDGIQEEAARQA